MKTEIARIKIGKKGKAELLDDPPDSYEHAFRVTTDNSQADTWILCPEVHETQEWINELNHA